jgi:hypothetical protein
MLRTGNRLFSTWMH